MSQTPRQPERRQFLLRIGAAAGCGALVPLLHGCESAELYTLPPLHVKETFDLGKSPYDVLKTVGASLDVNFGNVDGLLVRVSDAQIIGVTRICPHQQGNIKWDKAGATLVCTTHLAKFATNGAVTGQPNNGDTLTTLLPTWAVSFDAATGKGTVQT